MGMFTPYAQDPREMSNKLVQLQVLQSENRHLWLGCDLQRSHRIEWLREVKYPRLNMFRSGHYKHVYGTGPELAGPHLQTRSSWRDQGQRHDRFRQ